LDYAELQASKQRLMKMQDWALKLDAFLSFNELDILKNAGKISASIAKAFAEDEYDKFRAIQDQTYKSDFDKLCEASKSLNSDEDDSQSN
jgi:hypothetical protein